MNPDAPQFRIVTRKHRIQRACTERYHLPRHGVSVLRSNQSLPTEWLSAFLFQPGIAIKSADLTDWAKGEIALHGEESQELESIHYRRVYGAHRSVWRRRRRGRHAIF